MISNRFLINHRFLINRNHPKFFGINGFFVVIKVLRTNLALLIFLAELL